MAGKKKEKKECCKYFLDHPQIKRQPAPGNGTSPLASAITTIASGGTPKPKGSNPGTVVGGGTTIKGTGGK